MRALIIENNPAYREMLSHSLAEQGFENDTGDSIEIALEYADSENTTSSVSTRNSATAAASDSSNTVTGTNAIAKRPSCF